jgi:biofilm PGA synthesis N-glycosyltransferase PgaC
MTQQWSPDVLVSLQVLLWLAVGTIFYTFLGYPLLIGLLARCARRPVRQAAITPRVTLLIPAYNEAAVIARKIENSLALDYPPEQLEIVVVTDGSNDGTADIVAGYADRGVHLYHQPQRQGKMAAVNRVMPLVGGEIVVFSDANAMIGRGALRALVRNFADPSVGGVAGEKQVLGGGEGLYWRYESFLKRCDSALSSVVGAAGELFAIRRSLFEPPPPDAVIDDFVMSLRLVEADWRVMYEAEAVATEEPSPTLAGEWRRRVRIAAGGFQSIRWLPGLLSPARGWVAWQYFSHRVLGSHALSAASSLWTQPAAARTAVLPARLPGADRALRCCAAGTCACAAWHTTWAASCRVLLLLHQCGRSGGFPAIRDWDATCDVGQGAIGLAAQCRFSCTPGRWGWVTCQAARAGF